MFNDTSGHGTCTNYVPLKCQKCTWEGSLIQTFRAALCLEQRSVAASSQKGKTMGTPGIEQICTLQNPGQCPFPLPQFALTHSSSITSCPQIRPLFPHRICGWVVKP